MHALLWIGFGIVAVVALAIGITSADDFCENPGDELFAEPPTPKQIRQMNEKIRKQNGAGSSDLSGATGAFSDHEVAHSRSH